MLPKPKIYRRIGRLVAHDDAGEADADLLQLLNGALSDRGGVSR